MKEIPPLDKKEIGKRIKFVRESFSLNKQEFANRIGCSRSAILPIEEGKALPSGELGFRFIEHFNINIHWLVSGNGEPYLEKNSLEKIPADRELEYKQQIAHLEGQVSILKEQVTQYIFSPDWFRSRGKD
jgi:DNA-binding XRE family transcriptional regulator